MLSATILAIFFVPVFFVVTLRLFKADSTEQDAKGSGTPPAAAAP